MNYIVHDTQTVEDKISSGQKIKRRQKKNFLVTHLGDPTTSMSTKSSYRTMLSPWGPGRPSSLNSRTTSASSCSKNDRPKRCYVCVGGGAVAREGEGGV